MTADHRVEWRHDSDVVRGQLICEADEWAVCRIYWLWSYAAPVVES